MNLKKALKVTLGIVGIAWGTHEIIKRNTSENEEKSDIGNNSEKDADIKAVIGNGKSRNLAKEKFEETKKMVPDKNVLSEKNVEKLTDDTQEVVELDEEDFFKENQLDSNDIKKSDNQKLEETLEKESEEALKLQNELMEEIEEKTQISKVKEEVLSSDKETMNEIKENNMNNGVIDEEYSIFGEFNKEDSMPEIIDSATNSVLYEEENEQHEDNKEEIETHEKIINPGDVFVRKQDSNRKNFDVTLQVELHLKEEDLLRVGIKEIPYVKIFREAIVGLPMDTLRSFTASKTIINNIEKELIQRYDIISLKTNLKKFTIREA